MLRNYIYPVLFAILAIQSFAAADMTVTNTSLGISAYLPDNWIVTQVNDSYVTFTDTTFTYGSQIAIKKFTRNPADYLLPNDWTRAHVIAHLLVAQYSYDPFGAVLYFDSSATCVQDSLWAPELFCEFYTIDTNLGSWDEYMRYVAVGNYGYELYALGDTADMKQNIGMYMAIIRFVHFTRSSATVLTQAPATMRRSFAAARAGQPASDMYDILGKRVPERHRANGIYYRPASASLTIKVK
ncbi:MAG: hypothetical protein PHC61_07765 [Chitinivibrionales bacterium]|nr:hypothetical protein [Chitinivibrionales bacterium]